MPELLKRIIETIREYEQEKNSEYMSLKHKLDGLVKERELVIKHLKNNDIEVLKTYFNIK